jgi:hypothetical protein
MQHTRFLLMHPRLAGSPFFSERGLLHTLPHAIYHFKKAQRYELVSRIYSLLMPIWERDRRHVTNLAKSHLFMGGYGVVRHLVLNREFGRFFVQSFFLVLGKETTCKLQP